MVPKIPKPQPLPPPPEYADARLAGEKIRREPKNSTVLTSPVGDISAPATAKKTLLGQ